MNKSIATVLLALAALPAGAAPFEWGGLGGTSDWSDAGNWTPGVPPNDGTANILHTAPGLINSPVVDAAWAINSLVVPSYNSITLTGSTLTFQGAGALLSIGNPSSIANALVFDAFVSVEVATSLTLVGGITGAGGLTKNLAGDLTIANNTLSLGLTTVNAGTLRLGDGILGPAVVNMVVNNAAMAFNVPGGISLNGPFSGTGSVTVEGGAVICFACGTMLHAGTTTINAGALLASSLDNNALLTVNGQLDTGAAFVGSLTGTGTINNNGLIQVGGDGTNASFTGTAISGVGMFTKVGGGNQVLAHVATYNGLTTVSGGTLTLGNGVSGPPFVNAVVNNAAMAFNVPGGIALNGPFSGTGSVTVLGGSVACFACGIMLHAGTTTINAGALLGSSLDNNALLTVNGQFNTGAATAGSLTGTGTITNNGLIQVGGDGTNASFTGPTLFGPGMFTKVGGGNQVLAHVNTYGGLTTVSGGTLTLGNGVSGPPFVNMVLNNAAMAFNVPGGISLNGPFNGTGSVTVEGGAVICFACGTMLHAGTTTINAGALLASPLNNNALLTVNGTFDSGDITAGSLTGSGTLNINGGGNAVIGGDNTNTTFSGVLGSNGNYGKVGTGTLTLTGVSTLTGFTVVSGGTLLVNGTLPGPVLVGAGATLGGTGTVGPIQVNAVGTLSPGLSPGILNTGSLILVGILLQEIDGPALGAQYDNVNTSGTVNVGGATLTLAGAYVPVAGNTFTIIANDGVDPIVGTFAGLPEGATVVFNGVTLRITYVGGTGNDVVLAVVAPAPAGVGGPPIPTLSEWMLAMLALLMLIAGVRARRR